MSLAHKPIKPFHIDVDGFRLPGYFSPEAYRSALCYKPRPDDLFIVTYPKCGTTWVQNIVACIFREGKPYSSGLEFLTQSPFLELTGAKAADTMKRPGAIKLHLPFQLTPWSSQAKYIFVARNPKDCCVSYYYHTKNMPAHKFVDGEFDVYFDIFIEGRGDFGDYFDTLLSWYEHRNDTNVLFITYESLKKDIRGGVFKIAEFIDPKYKKAMEENDQFVQDIIHHCSFKYMQETLNKSFVDFFNLPKEFVENNEDIPEGLRQLFTKEDSTKIIDENSNFIRKGIIGDWRNHFSPMQNARMDQKFRERTAGTNIFNLWRDDM